MIRTKPKSRRYLGNIYGVASKLGRDPFFEIRLDREQVNALDRLLQKADGDGRCALSLTASFHQLNRLRVTEVDPPDYESRAPKEYLRDNVRVSGKEGRSCNIELSARWGAPAMRKELRSAADRAREFILLRIPHKRPLVQIIPDVDLELESDQEILGASMASAAKLLPREDFSDWERK